MMRNHRMIAATLLIFLLLSAVPASTMPAAAPQLQPLSLLAQKGGESVAVASRGGYAYAGIGPRLVILDVMSDPANPVVVGQSPLLAGVVQGVAVSGNMAYVTMGEAGVQIVDILDPAAPDLAGSYDTAGFAFGIAVAGNYACIADGASGLVVLDVSNPDVPSMWWSYDTPGSAGAVAVVADASETYAYVADSHGGLQILEIAPTPAYEGSYVPAGADFAGLAVAEPYVYVADAPSGLRIVDATDRLAPVEVGDASTVGTPQGVALNDTYAYLALGDEGLSVIDVSDRALPAEVGFVDTPGWSYGVVTSGAYAYVADGGGGLRIVNVAVADNPAEAGSYTPPGVLEGVTVFSDRAYTAEGDLGASVVDLSVATDPTKVGAFDTPGYAWDADADGDYAYVADGDEGLYILDVSDPSAIVKSGFSPTSASAEGVALNGDYAVVADGSAGLSIVGVSLPAAPTEVGTYSTLGSALDVAVDEADLAYVATGLEGLEIVDVHDPARPDYVGLFPTDDYAEGVSTYRGYVYVADGLGGLQILDATDPAATVVMGSLPSADYALDVDTMGNYYAFLADGYAGLRVVDVSDPSAPAEVAAYDTPGYATGITAVGGYLLVADWDGGLWLFQFGEADLGVSKTDGVDMVSPGMPITYTVVVSNAGPTALAGVSVSDTLPAEVIGGGWLCDDTPGSGCPAGSGSGDILAEIDLAAGGQVTFTITGTVALDAVGTLTNSVSVKAPAGVTELNEGNETARDVDRIQPLADLTVTKQASAGKVTVGTSLTYTIHVANDGPATANGVLLTDTLPAGVEPGHIPPACSLQGGLIVCDLNDLDLGSGLDVTVVVTPTATGTITNEVSVSSDTVDPAGANDVAQAVVTVDAAPTQHYYTYLPMVYKP